MKQFWSRHQSTIAYLLFAVTVGINLNFLHNEQERDENQTHERVHDLCGTEERFIKVLKDLINLNEAIEVPTGATEDLRALIEDANVRREEFLKAANDKLVPSETCTEVLDSD